MEIITKNNKQFYRFKIGDEFTAISGKGSFNKMKKEGLCSDTYNEQQGFIYPFYDGSTINNHIKGYCREYNYDGIAIKVAKDGAESGNTKYIKGKSFNAGHSYYLLSKHFSNEYVSLYFSNYLPEFQQGTSIPSVKFSDYKNEYIEIPVNHEELSIVIKRILEYKQLSKQLSKQMKDYKLAILQKSEKAIKHWKETGQKDKYITFKIGDEFTFKAWSKLYSERNLREWYDGDTMFNAMEKLNLVSKKYDLNRGYIYPFYDSSTIKNHIKGFSKKWSYDGVAFKVSEIGASSGELVKITNKSFIGRNCYLLESKTYCNEYILLLLRKKIPLYRQGTTMPSAMFSYYCNEEIIVPYNHKEISKKIEQLNQWQIIVDKTLKQMEEYIEGVLQSSLK